MDFENYDYEGHVDNLVDIIQNKIKVNKVTILTGNNGSGKSLIRKCLWSGINKQLGIEGKKPTVADVSMQRRTSLHSELGGGGVFLRDVEWNPTSLETVGFIKTLINSCEHEAKRFLVIDEPEIGCSREVQISLAKFINKYWDDFHNPEKCYGLLIITHSSDLVTNLKHDAFVNIQGMTEDEWLNRPLVEIDFDKLSEFSDRLYRTIQKRTR